MKISQSAAISFLLVSIQAMAADLPAPMITGLTHPESVCVGKDGRLYITEIGESGKDGDGKVTVIIDGKPSAFATGLDDPKGIVAYQDVFYATDKTKVVKVDSKGAVTTLVAADKFPATPLFLNDIEVATDSGTLYVSDTGDLKGSEGKIFAIDLKTGKADLLIDAKTLPGLNMPNGLLMDGKSHLLMVDFGNGNLYRIKLSDKSAEKIGEGFDGGDGLTWDRKGPLYVTSWKTGKVFRIAKLGEKPTLISDKFEQAADSCLDPSGTSLLVPDTKAGTVTAVPIRP